MSGGRDSKDVDARSRNASRHKHSPCTGTTIKSKKSGGTSTRAGKKCIDKMSKNDITDSTMKGVRQAR